MQIKKSWNKCKFIDFLSVLYVTLVKYVEHLMCTDLRFDPARPTTGVGGSKGGGGDGFCMIKRTSVSFVVSMYRRSVQFRYFF
jgi:hypothetical protein